MEQTDRLLRLPQVIDLIGLRRSHIYQMVRDGEFPPPVRLTRRCVAWRLSSVMRWIADRELVTE